MSLLRGAAREFEVEAFSDHMDALLAIGQRQPNLVLVSAEAGSNNESMHMVGRLTAKKDSCPIAVYGNNSSQAKDASGSGGFEFIPSTDGKEIRKRVYTILGR